jgi:hypothetical protein
MQKFPKSFPPGATIPAAVKFTRSEIADNVYALDSVNDQDEEGKNILTFLVGPVVFLQSQHSHSSREPCWSDT